MDRFQDCCKAKATNALLQSYKVSLDAIIIYNKLNKNNNWDIKNVYYNILNKYDIKCPIFKIQVSNCNKIKF